MRARPLPSCLLRSPTPRHRPGALLALGLLTLSPPAFAETPAGDKLARLGFSYDPQVHAAAVAKQAAGLLDTDPPPPGVVRLPKHRVISRSLPLNERDLLTPQGRIEVAKQRYLAPIYQKTLGPLAAVVSLLNNPLGGWNPNAPEAMALYEDDDQLRRRREVQDLSDLAALADAARKNRDAARPPPAKPKH